MYIYFLVVNFQLNWLDYYSQIDFFSSFFFEIDFGIFGVPNSQGCKVSKELNNIYDNLLHLESEEPSFLWGSRE